MHFANSTLGFVVVAAICFVVLLQNFTEVHVKPLLHELQALRKAVDLQMTELNKQLQRMYDRSWKNEQSIRELKDVVAYQLPELRKFLGLMYEHDRADAAKTRDLIKPLTSALVEHEFIEIVSKLARGDFS